MIIKLRDRHVAHDPSFIKNTKKLVFSREKVTDNDVVIYTNRNFHEFFPKAKKHIALLMESNENHEKAYQYLLINNKKYDIVLTYNKKLLDRGENFKKILYGTTWMHLNYQKIYTKTKKCSLIASDKKWLSGHKLRHQLINNILTSNTIIDIYGNNFKNLPHTKNPNPKSLDNKKIMALKDYMFSITIENCKEDYYFSEQLIDCFLTGTIPIYWGCPSIDLFFNTKGMLIFDTIDECLNIIDNLSVEHYNSMAPFIKENFEIAKKYIDFKIDEKYILEIL